MIRIIIIVIVISLLVISATPEDKTESLAKSVQIRRDTYGIPHIKAKSKEALYFGMGFVQAEDRLELLAKNYLISQGRGAEFFGDRYLASDLVIARFRINEIAEREFAQADKEFKQIFEAYTQGLNYYIDIHRDTLPDWIPRFTPMDSFSHVIRSFSEFIYQRHANEVRQQLKQLGSNIWAIAPQRTKKGHTLFLADSHLPWYDQYIWHESHLTVPGKINVAGVSLIGMPIIAMGHNDFMAWSLSANNPDMVDLYEVKIDEEKRQYYYNGILYPFDKNEVIIKVKDKDGMREEKQELLSTRHGPIVRIKGDKAYAVKVAGVGNVNGIMAWTHFPTVQSFSEFKRILNNHPLCFFNIAYGDRDGNIFLASSGSIPIRKDGHDWKGIVDGSISETEWSAFHSFKDMPKISNPSCGYVQNSNGNPGYTALSDVFNINDYSFMFMDREAINWRTQLGLIMLENEKKFTLEKLIACKWSTRLLTAERFKDELLKICRQYTVPAKNKDILNDAIKVLEKWDNSTSLDNRGAQLFLDWIYSYINELGENSWAEQWSAKEPISTPRGIANKKVAVECLIEAARWNKERYGTISPLWSDINVMKRGDKSYPLAGEGGVLGSFRATFWGRDKDGSNLAVGGEAFVMVVEFSEQLKVFTITPYGSTDNPKSPHFADQTELFVKDQMKPAWFSEEEVKANLKRIYTPYKVKSNMKED